MREMFVSQGRPTARKRRGTPPFSKKKETSGIGEKREGKGKSAIWEVVVT